MPMEQTDRLKEEQPAYHVSPEPREKQPACDTSSREEAECPLCVGRMRLWAGFYRCPNCGYKESCCF